MKRITDMGRSRRFTAAAAGMFALGLVVFVAVALADAGNPITGTIKGAVVDNGNGTVTVSVRGQWNWVSHDTDCNTDRAATGVGIIWNDPTEPGYVVPGGDASNAVGISVLRAAGNGANVVDQMVHPVDRGNVPEGYIAAGTDYPTGQAFLDPVPPDPASFAAWRGGCGRLPLAATASKGSHADRTGQTCANGTLNCLGHPWGSWGYEKTYSHTYEKIQSSGPNAGKSGLPGKVCVNFYDVHGGGTGADFQDVDKAKEITVDEAGDNSIKTNDFDATEGKNCISLVTPALTTNATDGPAGGTIHDTAHLAGLPAGAGGTITFKAYLRPAATADCSGTAAFTSAAVSVNGSGDYASGDFTPGSVGKYDWTAGYTGDPGKLVLPADSPCGAANETSTVVKAGPTLSTNAGGPYRVGADGKVNLTDTATLSGATSTATGTVTFKLYGPDPTPDSDPGDDCPAGKLVGTATAAVSGGTAGPSSPAFAVGKGRYHWTASYDGDGNNNGATSPCGADNENPLAIAPAISIAKGPDAQSVVSGGMASFTIRVTNTGDVTLTDVVVTDALAPACDRTKAEISALASMAPQAVVEYQCSLANVTAGFTNVAIASGKPPVGPNVTADNDAAVTVPGTPPPPPVVTHPAIAIVKGPDAQTVVSGGTATFQITVTNTGDVTLTDVVVTDALAPGCSRTKAIIPALASMAPGASLNYSCTLENVTAGFINVAIATGKPPTGPGVSANDSAPVTVTKPLTPPTVKKPVTPPKVKKPLTPPKVKKPVTPPKVSVPVKHPAISITKGPKSQTVAQGGTATFSITVTNTGDVTLTNVEVTDRLSPRCDRRIGAMAPGASLTYTCTLSNVRTGFLNVAVVTGRAPSGKKVMAKDSAQVKPAPKPPKKVEVAPVVVSNNRPRTTG